MPKPKALYVCSNCDGQFPTWQGRCPECSAWGTLELKAGSEARLSDAKPGVATPFSTLEGKTFSRLTTGMSELDHVLGGGIVPGSLLLLGGEPGIGKSTLVLELAAGLARQKQATLYVSGEESGEQLKLRLDRLKLPTDQLSFLGATDVETILATARDAKPALVIVDSIQTTTSAQLPAEAGTIAQVRTVTNALLDFAKKGTTSVIIIGHVTKEGQVAGPKTLEHLVDTVLYLEGDHQHQYRLLRATKNRFGSTNEIGVFAMEGRGLVEVANPSALFLAERQAGSGSVVTASVEGSRAWLVEVQALVNPTAFGLPRRTGSGVDAQRLQLLIAVLSRRVGFSLGNQDVFVNVVGGFRLTEPAADLAIAAAVASSFRDVKLDSETALVGEVGLGGELRSVPFLDRRVAEVSKLGFKRMIISAGSQASSSKLQLIRVKTLREGLKAALGKDAG
jgi:DNA repair protein RadA/Sms